MASKKHRINIITGLVIIILFIIAIFAILRFVLEPQQIEQKYELLIDLLGIIFAAAGLIGAGLWFIFQGKIEEEITNKAEEERYLSRIELKISRGLFHMLLYKNLYEELTQSQDKNKKAIRQIENAIFNIEKAIEYLQEIEQEKYLDYIFITNNNLAYYLTRRWNYYKDNKDEASFKQYLKENEDMAKKYDGDRLIALECMTYLKEKRASREKPEYAKNFADTSVWVEKIFK